MAKVPEAEKRTVAFWSQEQWGGHEAPFQYSLASGFVSQDAQNYLCQLVTPDPDSLLAAMRGPGSLMAYPGAERAHTRLGRSAQQFAVNAGVDHVMFTSVSREFETAMLQPAEEHSLFDEVVFGEKDKPAVYGPKLKKVVFKLKYIDGHTGRTLWKTKVRCKGLFKRFDRMDEFVARKVHKRFPFRRG